MLGIVCFCRVCVLASAPLIQTQSAYFDVLGRLDKFCNNHFVCVRGARWAAEGRTNGPQHHHVAGGGVETTTTT